MARELAPPKIIENDIPSRGSKDQKTVILEADASSDDEAAGAAGQNKNGRADSSSTESSGPKTPPEHHQDERRFIFVPKHEDHHNIDEDEQPRRGSYVRVREGHTPAPPVRSKSPARPDLRVDSNLGKRNEPLPYTGPRGSTPYAHVPEPSKNKFPAEYMLSPEAMTPNRNFPNGRLDLRGRRSDLNRQEIKRTLSSSHTGSGQRPTPPRNASAIGVSGESARSSSYEPLPRQGRNLDPRATDEKRREVSPFTGLHKSDVFDSESESDPDISPDEMSPPRRTRRNTQYSMTSSDLRQTPAAVKESVKKTRPDPINIGHAGVPQTVRQDSTQTNPKTPSSVKSTTSSFRQEMAQKPNSPSVRPIYDGNGPSVVPQTSRERTQSYLATPPSPHGSIGHGSRPGSRPESREGSNPNSRASTPEHPLRPTRHSTLDVPSQLPFHHPVSGTGPTYGAPPGPLMPSNATKVHSKLDRHEEVQARPVPGSRYTSPMPSPNGNKGQFEDGRAGEPPPASENRSGTFPLNDRWLHSRESSIGQPFVQGNTKLVTEPAEVPVRRNLDTQPTRKSGETARAPTAPFKPTLRRRPSPGVPVCCRLQRLVDAPGAP
jgi:hypothetical protein